MKQILSSIALIFCMVSMIATAHASQAYKVIVQPINGTAGTAIIGTIEEGSYLNFGTPSQKDAPEVYIEMQEHNDKPYLSIVPNTRELAGLQKYDSDDGQSHIQIPVVNHRYNNYMFSVDERSRSQSVKVRFPESKVDNMRVTIIRLDNDKH